MHASFRRLGARVVAVEPQPAAFRALRLLFGKDERVALVPAAVGAARGSVPLFLNTRNPTVSTASADFVAAAKAAPGWQGERWDRSMQAPLVTLDDLIAEHGTPDFVKIDVEGFEAEVITGLSRPIAALSFEFTIIQREIALEALSSLARLSDFGFNFSVGERHVLEFPEWRSADELAEFLRSAPDDLNSGDVYARQLF